MLEKAVEKKIKDYLFTQGCYHIKIHGSAFMVSGIPDIIACIKGLFVGIEVKAPGRLNNQSQEQKIHQKNIELSGGIYLLVDNLEEVVAFVEGL